MDLALTSSVGLIHYRTGRRILNSSEAMRASSGTIQWDSSDSDERPEKLDVAFILGLGPADM